MNKKKKLGVGFIILALLLTIVGFVVGQYKYNHTFSGPYVDEWEGTANYNNDRMEAYIVGGLFFWIPAAIAATTGVLALSKKKRKKKK